MAFRFETLDIWKNAITFIKDIYLLTKSFPREELFSLVDQLRRAANSIAANIAEGCGSSSKKEFAHYLDIAIKSLYEAVSHLYVAKELEYISQKDYDRLYFTAENLSKRIRAFKSVILKNSMP